MVAQGRTVILFGGSSPDDGPMNDLYALACPGKAQRWCFGRVGLMPLPLPRATPPAVRFGLLRVAAVVAAAVAAVVGDVDAFWFSCMDQWTSLPANGTGGSWGPVDPHPCPVSCMPCFCTPPLRWHRRRLVPPLQPLEVTLRTLAPELGRGRAQTWVQMRVWQPVPVTHLLAWPPPAPVRSWG
jgi:hypothetical protein